MADRGGASPRDLSERRRRGTGTCVWHEPVGKWMAQLRLKDGRRPTRYFEGKPPPKRPWRRDPRPPEALAWLDALRREQETGRVTWSGPLTVGEHVAEWFELRLPQLGAGTAKIYRTLLGLLAADELSGQRLDAVRPNHVQAFFNRLLAAGKAPKTVHDVRGVLNIALKAAWEWERIPRNPVTHTRVLVTPVRERRAWTTDEARQFLAQSGGKSGVNCSNICSKQDQFAALWHVLLYTGMRQGEARGLRWSDVDFEHHTLSIRRHVSDEGNAVLDHRKAGGADRLPMVPPLEEALLCHKRAHPVAISSLNSYLFSRDDGGPLNGAQVRYAFGQACKAAGLVPLTPHELRHTAATMLSDSGVPILTIASILGHSSTNMLEQKYHHGSDAERRKALEMLSDRLSG